MRPDQAWADPGLVRARFLARAARARALSSRALRLPARAPRSRSPLSLSAPCISSGAHGIGNVCLERVRLLMITNAHR